MDFELLGRSFELSGGEIQQASVRSAVAALERAAGYIDLYDVETAVHSVYRDKGRLPPVRMTG